MTAKDPVVVFDHVYKKFSRGELHTTLRDLVPAMIGRLWPFGHKNAVTDLKGTEFWAVQDVSFSLGRGDSLGIIGPNGSGKSTTLKLLSGILRPERGSYSVQGKLSALIEVGAGFHPDLTGRENIFLNGCILGMTRKEVAARFNEIVEFAGVEDFIDTPVKRYSTGMAVRLGFAVATTVRPDVLLVDEVLAVGDMEFRARCHERMDHMRHNGVTTILVSHNLSEVRNLCDRTLMLFRGQCLMEGPTPKILEAYHKTIGEGIRKEQDRNAEKYRSERRPTAVKITAVDLVDNAGNPCETFGTTNPATLRIRYCCTQPVDRLQFRVDLTWATDDYLATSFDSELGGLKLSPASAGEGAIELHLPVLGIEPNLYALRVFAHDGRGATYDVSDRARFVVFEDVPVPGVFLMNHQWKAIDPASVPIAEAAGLTKVADAAA